jgi:hypothetical protein
MAVFTTAVFTITAAACAMALANAFVHRTWKVEGELKCRPWRTFIVVLSNRQCLCPSLAPVFVFAIVP